MSGASLPASQDIRQTPEQFDAMLAADIAHIRAADVSDSLKREAERASRLMARVFTGPLMTDPTVSAAIVAAGQREAA